MKMFLWLAVSTVIAVAVLPSLPAKIILSAFVLLAALANAARRAPVGCQDEGGFHLLTTKVRASGEFRAQKSCMVFMFPVYL